MAQKHGKYGGNVARDERTVWTQMQEIGAAIWFLLLLKMPTLYGYWRSELPILLCQLLSEISPRIQASPLFLNQYKRRRAEPLLLSIFR